MEGTTSVTWQFKFTCSMFAILFLAIGWLILIGSAMCALAICLFLFVVVPLIFRYSYALQRNMLFLDFVKWPPSSAVNAPEKAGLSGARNFYVVTDENVRLGVWHILPKSLLPQSKRKIDVALDGDWYEKRLNSGNPILLYMHGNAGSRAAAHRVHLYQVLQNLDYHVIAFDYRSYSDSSSVEPSERGVVADGVFMYKWLASRSQAPIFVWGHSLGTGVASHALANLASEGIECFGLVLESPFNNMRDEFRSHPVAQIFKILPWFEACFVEPPYNNGLQFDSDEHLAKILAPIAILHAEDDRVVPFSLGRKLFYAIQKKRSKNAYDVEFWRFEGKLGHGHKNIYRDPSLPNIIRNFVRNSINMQQKTSANSTTEP